jgi:hypothetical protein
VIAAYGQQFQLTAHDAGDLELAARAGSTTLATFVNQLDGAMRQVGGRTSAQPDAAQPAPIPSLRGSLRVAERRFPFP